MFSVVILINYANVVTIMSKIKSDYLPESVRNRKDLDIRAGDTVRVNIKIQEKGKTRIQAFEGLVLARKHGAENGGTFTVRKVSNNVGVERIFPLYSPSIDSINVLRRAKVRRSKLYFLREAVSKRMRYKLRRITDIGSGTADLPEWMNENQPEVVVDAADMMDEVVEETPTVKEAATPEAEAESPAEVEDAPTAEESAADEIAPEADDLTKIEGIGPVIAKTLADNGITTFAALADAKDEATQEMIKEVKGNHQAGTWNEQAALARDGKWDELKELQDKLDGGKEA